MATLPKDPSRRDVLKALAVAPAMLSAASPFEPPQTASAPLATKLQVGIVSRHLPWTSVEDAIDLAKTAGFDAIEWNVRAGTHVPPERVEQDLPRVIELTRKAGLATPMISTGCAPRCARQR